MYWYNVPSSAISSVEPLAVVHTWCAFSKAYSDVQVHIRLFKPRFIEFIEVFYCVYLHSSFELVTVHALTLRLLVDFSHRGGVRQQVVVLGFVLGVQLDTRLEQRIQQQFYSSHRQGVARLRSR